MGTRTLTGWVVPGEGSIYGLQSGADSVRDVVDVLDAEPLLPREIVTLALWTAEYYAAGAGEALATAMPPQSAVFSRRVAVLTGAGRANELQIGLRRRALDLLREHGELTVDSLVRRVAAEASGAKEGKGAVDGLIRDGLIEITQPLTGRREAFRTVARIRLTALADDDVRRGKRQGELIGLLRGAPEGLTARELAARGLTWDIAKRLAATGLAAIDQVRVDRDPFEHAALSTQHQAPSTQHP